MSAGGNAIPAIHFFDDSGQQRSTNDLAGAPTILVPIYTRCHGSCPRITASLKQAILKSSTPTGSYHVLLLSFDSRDASSDLQHFREKEHLPIQWILAHAREKDAKSLTESIGFRYAAADGQFVHPNLVAILDRRLNVSTVLEGTRYTARQIDRALSAASGGRDWKGAIEAPALCLGLLLLVLSTGYLIHLILRKVKA